VGAGVAALGVGVGSTGSVKAASGTPFPTDPSEWSVSTSKPEDTEINVSSAGSGISCDFTENSVASETFEYSTTATETGTVDLDWMTSGWSTEYTTYFEASISVNGHKTELLHRYKRRDALDGSGQTTLSINEGDEITVRVQAGGINGYYGYTGGTISGSLELTPGNSGQGSSEAISHAAGSWSDSGPGSHDISSGDTTVEFTYDGNDYWWETWDYETTAQSDATLEVDWSYEGHHSWYWAAAEAYIEVNGDRQRLVDEGVDGNFSFSGRTKLSVSKGDTVRVILKGRHFDWSRIKRGTFNATFSEV